MYTGPAPDTDRYALDAEVRDHNTKNIAGHLIFHRESNLFLDAPIPEKYFIFFGLNAKPSLLDYVIGLYLVIQ